MKKLILLIFIGTLVPGFFVIAQVSQFCGTTETSIIFERLLENKKLLATHPITERATRYIPIKFHIIGDNNGNGAVLEEDVLSFLCKLNDFYAPFNIQFFIKDGFNYINNTLAANDPTSSGGQQVLTNNKVPYLINIYITQEIANSQSGLQAYYAPGGPNYALDFIVMQKFVATNYTSAAIHALGHFFSLVHTDNGWDYSPYDPLIHGNPVNILLSPDGVDIEFVDQSNCETAGDLICDTPPDYNFADKYWQNNFCLPLDGSVKDYHGDKIYSDVENVMANYGNCNNFHNTVGQGEIMKMDIINRSMSLGPKRINSTETPDSNIINANNISPNIQNGSIIANYGDIKLDWDDIPGAKAYMIEIDDNINFNGPFKKYAKVNISEWTAKGLTKNKYYFWHVYPYNDYFVCAGYSMPFEFKTGQWLVSANEIKELSNWKRNPNPVNRNTNITLELNSLNAFIADILITEITGKTVSNMKNISIKGGTQSLEISTATLTAGIYLVQLRTATGISTQKLAIQN